MNTILKVIDIMEEISKFNIIGYFIKVVTPTNLHDLCSNILNPDSIFLVVTSYEQVDGFLKELKKLLFQNSTYNWYDIRGYDSQYVPIVCVVTH